MEDLSGEAARTQTGSNMETIGRGLTQGMAVYTATMRSRKGKTYSVLDPTPRDRPSSRSDARMIGPGSCQQRPLGVV